MHGHNYYVCSSVIRDFSHIPLQSAEVVKEDLLDDIILESGPYKPPEKILKRSSMASSETEGATTADTIQPNQ